MDNCVTTKVTSAGDDWTIVVRGADWTRTYPVAEEEKNREKLSQQAEEERVVEALKAVGWVEQDDQGSFPLLQLTGHRLPGDEGTAWTWRAYREGADDELAAEDAYEMRHDERVRATIGAALTAVGAPSEPSQQDCAAAALLLELDCQKLLGERRAEAFRSLNGGWWTQNDGPAYLTAARLAVVLLRAEAGPWEESSRPSTFTVCELVANCPLGESALLAYAWLEKARQSAAKRGAEGVPDAREATHALRCAVSHDTELDAGVRTKATELRTAWLGQWLPDWAQVCGKRLDHSGTALEAARSPA